MNDEIYTCPQCYIGHVRSTTLPYYAIVEGMLLIAPNLPALRCDVCDFQEFDQEAVKRLYEMMEMPLGDDDLTTRQPPLPNENRTNSRARRLKP